MPRARALADDPFHGKHSKDDIYEERQWAVMSEPAEAIGADAPRKRSEKRSTMELQIIRITSHEQ